MSQSSTEGGSGQEPGANGGPGQEPGADTGKPGQEPGADSGKVDIATMSEADLRTYAAKVAKDAEDARREAANYRTRATSAEGKVTEAERSAMTEAQRIQSDLQTAQQENQGLKDQVRDLTVGASAREALAGAGALNAMTAFKTLDLSGVETGPDGQPKADQLQAAITKLKQSDPYLFRRNASADAGNGGGDQAPQGSQGINDYIRGKAR